MLAGMYLSVPRILHHRKTSLASNTTVCSNEAVILGKFDDLLKKLGSEVTQMDCNLLFEKSLFGLQELELNMTNDQVDQEYQVRKSAA